MFGGFPDAFLKKKTLSVWTNNLINTYFERDLPNLGFAADSITAKRLWSMLAHYHGNMLHYSELGRSLEKSNSTISSYIGFLEKAFLTRTTQRLF